MKKLVYSAVALLFFLSAFTSSAQRQAFHKGAFLLSISEGSTTANYSTSNTTNLSQPREKFSCEMDGIRDPLFIEYGLSKRWGIGLSSGADIFSVNSFDYYGFKTPENKPLTVTTSEFTFDLNYHLYISKRFDWSVYSSLGSFSVGFKQQVGETNYDYKAKGGIFRVGTKFRYYFWKRLGFMMMLSSYSGNASPKQGSAIHEGGQTYSTNISGTATEWGLCFRFN
jgi:hypothetical protein